jgi:hypothetical protein
MSATILQFRPRVAPRSRSALQSLVADRLLPLVGRHARIVASRRLFREPIPASVVVASLPFAIALMRFSSDCRPDKVCRPIKTFVFIIFPSRRPYTGTSPL